MQQHCSNESILWGLIGISLDSHIPPCHYSLSSHSFCFSVTLRLSLLSHLFRNSPLSPVMLFAQILNGGHLSSGFSLNTSSSKMTVTFHHSGFSLNTSSSHHPIHSSLIPSLSTCHPVSFLSQHLSYLIASYVFVCLLSGLPPSGWRLAVSIQYIIISDEIFSASLVFSQDRVSFSFGAT